MRARIWRGLTQENAVSRTLTEHETIVLALENGDAELAQALTLVHISGRRAVAALLGATTKTPPN